MGGGGALKYSSIHSQLRHQVEASSQTPAPAALPPEKQPPVLIEQKAGRVPETVWMFWRTDKSLESGGNGPTIPLSDIHGSVHRG